MSKYVRLTPFLSSSGQDLVKVSFPELEQVLGFPLPPSAYKYPAWWSNGGHDHSYAWMDAGYKTEQLNLKEQTVLFRRIADLAAGGQRLIKDSPGERSTVNDGPVKTNQVAKTLDVYGHRFRLLQRLIPQTNADDEVFRDYPHERYNNEKNHKLLHHGKGPFCRFSIHEWALPGVYLWVVDDTIIYIGETENLQKRFNAGYGLISPRKCFEGGQHTNCKMNNVLLSLHEQGKAVELYFYQTPDHQMLERNLLAKIRPPYNARG